MNVKEENEEIVICDKCLKPINTTKVLKPVNSIIIYTLCDKCTEVSENTNG